MGKAALVVGLFLFLLPGSRAFLFAAFFSMFGHVYPVYHGFKGGRGQAPLMGALLVINWFGVLIGNAAAVVLGYLTGSVLVMRWGWMVMMIPWYALYFKDPWYVAYITLSNLLFFFAMRREIAQSIAIYRDRKPSQEQASEILFMGRGLGRFLDRYSPPVLIRRALGKERR
jgi:glycerol-3-phosphate acyltransferase PlsY